MSIKKSSCNVLKSLLLHYHVILPLLGITLLAAAQCTRTPFPNHVIFISLDTTRPDHLGCYGNSWISTPHLDQLASESILFSDYMTVVPTTLPSHTSLFTGKYPHTHGTPKNGYMVNKKNVTLTELLKSSGFQTFGFIGSFALNSRFYFAQGFDHYDQECDKFTGTERRTQDERSAKSVTDATLRYLDKTGVPPNLFLFVHYFDPHKPFNPPPPYDSMYAWDGENTPPDTITVHYECPHTLNKQNWELSKNASLQYAGEISYMDSQIGRLLDYLREKRILNNAILVVTSDHGENFWEHMPYFHHGTATYQTTMQGVCIIRLPHIQQGGIKISSPVSSIDILPTLLKYLNLPIPEGIDGKPFDLTNIPETIGKRILYGQATLTRPWKVPEVKSGWQNLNKSRCIREGNLKFIQTPFANTEELYDLSQDPFEQKNLLRSSSPEISSLAKQLKKKLEAWAASTCPLQSFLENKSRKETIRKLKALGYM